jgi:hypothetical protein
MHINALRLSCYSATGITGSNMQEEMLLDLWLRLVMEDAKLVHASIGAATSKTLLIAWLGGFRERRTEFGTGLSVHGREGIKKGGMSWGV